MGKKKTAVLRGSTDGNQPFRNLRFACSKQRIVKTKLLACGRRFMTLQRIKILIKEDGRNESVPSFIQKVMFRPCFLLFSAHLLLSGKQYQKRE